jgi:hypothetical protein
MPKVIVPWGWHQSQRAFENRCQLYLPALQRAGTAKNDVAASIRRSGAA